jgi:acetylornithine deacetylase/succinyl-diaminopimelate desuccinylase-like protein
LTRADPALQYEIEFPAPPERRAMREVMMPLSVPRDHLLVQTLRASVVAIRGVEPAIGAVAPSYAGNDTSHLDRAGIPCCLYGPAGGFDEGRADRRTSVEQIVTCRASWRAPSRTSAALARALRRKHLTSPRGGGRVRCPGWRRSDVRVVPAAGIRKAG